MSAFSACTPLLQHLKPVSPQPSRLQGFAIHLFAVLHIVRGLCLVFYPAIGLSGVQLTYCDDAYPLGSLLGVRDVLLGGLLFTAGHHSLSQMRRVLAVLLLGDAADTFILIFWAACSWHRRAPVPEIVIWALTALLEHLTLWSMDASETQAHDLIREQTQGNAKLRLKTWLSETARGHPLDDSTAPRVPAPLRDVDEEAAHEIRHSTTSKY